MNESNEQKPKKEKICVVCLEEGSGVYFGALVCLPCKSFYIRSTKDGDPNFACAQNGSCDITKSNRLRCQFCRFEKCLSVGMARKEKPLVVEPEEGQELCAVCGDISNGVHFGRPSCEGCKKFFRRALKEFDEYKCSEDMECVINPRTRNNCRFCRYQKCIREGMSRDAIKMGRPRKKLKDDDSSPKKRAKIDKEYIDEVLFKESKLSPNSPVELTMPSTSTSEVTSDVAMLHTISELTKYNIKKEILSDETDSQYYTASSSDLSPSLRNSSCSSLSSLCAIAEKELQLRDRLPKTGNLMNEQVNSPRNNTEHNSQSNEEKAVSNVSAAEDPIDCKPNYKPKLGTQNSQAEMPSYVPHSVSQPRHTDGSTVEKSSGAPHGSIDAAEGDAELDRSQGEGGPPDPMVILRLISIMDNSVWKEIYDNLKQQHNAGREGSGAACQLLGSLMQLSQQTRRGHQIPNTQSTALQTPTLEGKELSNTHNITKTEHLGHRILPHKNSSYSAVSASSSNETFPQNWLLRGKPTGPQQSATGHAQLQEAPVTQYPGNSTCYNADIHQNTNLIQQNVQVKSESKMDHSMFTVEEETVLDEIVDLYSASDNYIGIPQHLTFNPPQYEKNIECDAKTCDDAPSLHHARLSLVSPSENSLIKQKAYSTQALDYKSIFRTTYWIRSTSLAGMEQFGVEHYKLVDLLKQSLDELLIETLPDNPKEYRCETTRSDIRAPPFWNLIRDRIIRNSTAIVTFCSKLPGYIKISSEHIKIMCQYGSFTAMIFISGVKRFDAKKKNFTCFWNFNLPSDEPVYHFRCELLKCGANINDANLDDIELALLVSLCMFSADFTEIPDDNMINRVHMVYWGALKSYMVTSNKGEKRLEELIQFMRKARMLTLWHQKILEYMKFDC